MNIVENAADLFRRINCEPFQYNNGSGVNDIVHFGDMVEISSKSRNRHYIQYNLCSQFCQRFTDPIIIVISTGKNSILLTPSLNPSYFKLSYSESGPCLFHDLSMDGSLTNRLLDSGLLKWQTVHSMIELLATIEILHQTLPRRKVLIVMDSMACLFQSQRVCHFALSTTYSIILISMMFLQTIGNALPVSSFAPECTKALFQLCDSHPSCIVMWILPTATNAHASTTATATSCKSSHKLPECCNGMLLCCS